MDETPDAAMFVFLFCNSLFFIKIGFIKDPD